VRGQRADFLEGTLIKQEGQALSGRHLAPLVLLIDTLLTATEYGPAAHLAQHLKVLLRLSAHRHRNSLRQYGSLNTPRTGWLIEYKSGIIGGRVCKVNEKFRTGLTEAA
jgi:hypothetical protein